MRLSLKIISLIFCIYTVLFSELFAQVYTGKKIVNKGDSCWLHSVEKGQTWYGIAKMYSVSIAQIRQYNANQDSVLKFKQLLFIPFNKPKGMVVDSTDFNRTNILKPLANTAYTIDPKKPLRVTVFLPFSFNELNQLKARDVLVKKQKLPKFTDNMTAYYRGLKAGFDKADLPVNFSIYDVGEKDTLLIKNWALKSGFESTDIIIGPIFQNPFNTLLKARTSFATPIIYPFIQNTISEINAHNLFYPLAGIKELIEGLADYCVDSLSKRTAAIQIKTSPKADSNEMQLIRLFINRVNRRVLCYNPLTIDTLVLNTPRNSGVLAVFTTNEVYLNKLITQLANSKSVSQTILCSYLDISRFQNLDMNDLNKLNFTFPSAYDLLYIKNLKYDDLSRCENEYYKFGEHVADVVSKQLQNDKTQIDFNGYTSLIQPSDGIINTYLKNSSLNGLIRNKGIVLYRYKDFTLKKINWQLSKNTLQQF